MSKGKETLSDRLKLSLKLLGISQSELAKRINVKPQIIQYLCSSKSEKSKFTFDIAEALNIDVSWLATGAGVPPDMLDKKNKNTIPILSYPQIKEWKIKGENLALTEDNIKLAINQDVNLNSFGLILNDKSMAPRFDVETIIIIEPTLQKHTELVGWYALIYLQSEDFIVFREITNDNNDLILRPSNKSLYKDIKLLPADIVIGICKEARWKYN